MPQPKESHYIVAVEYDGRESPPRIGEKLANGGVVREVFPITVDDLPEEMRARINRGEISSHDGIETFLKRRAQEPNDTLGRVAADLMQNGGEAMLGDVAQRIGAPEAEVTSLTKALRGIFTVGEDGLLSSPYLRPPQETSPHL